MVDNSETRDMDMDEEFKNNKDQSEDEPEDISDLTSRLEDDFSRVYPKVTNFSYIGEGHFGHVFRARYRDEPVAFKVMKDKWINPDNALSWNESDVKEAKKNFIFELGMHRVLSGIIDGIVSVYDGGEHSGHWYMVTELMKESNLDVVVDNYRDFLLKDRVMTMLRITEIVENIHNVQFHNDHPERGFIHRDLKPQNILFTRDTRIKYESNGNRTYSFEDGWDIKLTDFGLIRRIRPSDEEDYGHIVGTPAFMAPEQIVAPDEVDKRKDIYGLGATFYTMCNPGSHRGYIGDMVPSRFTKLAKEEPLDFSDRNKEIEPLRRIVMKCIRNDPSERYQSATHLKYALMDYAEQL